MFFITGMSISGQVLSSSVFLYYHFLHQSLTEHFVYEHLRHTFSYSLDHNVCRQDVNYYASITNDCVYHYEIEPVHVQGILNFQEHLDEESVAFTVDFHVVLVVFLYQTFVIFIDNFQDQVQHFADRHVMFVDQNFIVDNFYIEVKVYCLQQEVLQQRIFTSKRKRLSSKNDRIDSSVSQTVFLTIRSAKLPPI